MLESSQTTKGIMVSNFIVVLDDGETYSLTNGAVIYKVVNDKFFNLNEEVRDGIKQGHLIHATDLESIVNTPDLLDCE